MKKIFTYYFIVVASTFFSTMFMLNIHVKEPVKSYPEIKTFNDYYVYESPETKKDTASQNVGSENESTVKTADEKNKGIESINTDDNTEKTRIFKEEMLEGLIKQRNREFQGSNTNDMEKNINNININSLNKVVVTPEKILKVQREMNFSTKAKAINLLLKLGPSDMGEITRMAQDGVTPQEGYKMMDVLKKHLSDEEIKFLVNIVNEYFMDNGQKITPPQN